MIGLACDIDVWHLSLGHSSNKVLDHICRINIDIQYHTKNICDYCYYAKQHRLSFSNSESILMCLILCI